MIERPASTRTTEMLAFPLMTVLIRTEKHVLLSLRSCIPSPKVLVCLSSNIRSLLIDTVAPFVTAASVIGALQDLAMLVEHVARAFS